MFILKHALLFSADEGPLNVSDALYIFSPLPLGQPESTADVEYDQKAPKLDFFWTESGFPS